MQTRGVRVKELFNSDIQYIIPLFQRHYVWDMSEQWYPLWEDIMKKADNRLSDSQRGEFSHFTGAIVIQQKQTNVDEVPKYEIIDGQQRLTTFQVILCALRDVSNSSRFERIGAEAERHILNQGMSSDDSHNEKYKLVPTEFDRASFIALADGRVDESIDRICQTYIFFKRLIQDYADGQLTNIRALFHSILNDFGFVQILLDAGDEPERIFESLNARAKRLLDFDLLRNNLFLRARVEDDRDRLFREYWQHFENPYWEAKVARKTLSELFFDHFIRAKLAEEKITPLFNVYQKRIAGTGAIEEEFSQLKKYSDVYQEMTDCSPDSVIGQAMSFYKTFNITTLHPFILFVINELGVSGSELNLVLQVLESYAMRRIVCNTSRTQSYTKLVCRLIKRLGERDFSVDTFVNVLSYEKAKATRWPNDSDVFECLTTNLNMTHRDIRYVLYRIELEKRAENRMLEDHELVLNNQLSLEHIMPERWRTTWPLPIGTDEYDEPAYGCDETVLYEELFPYEYRENNPEWATEGSESQLADESYRSALSVAKGRNNFVQEIGNLTLVTGVLNSSLSNRPFSDKKGRLFQNSLLILNREICEYESWDIPEIAERSADLIGSFKSLWPSAKSFIERLSERL